MINDLMDPLHNMKNTSDCFAVVGIGAKSDDVLQKLSQVKWAFPDAVRICSIDESAAAPYDHDTICRMNLAGIQEILKSSIAFILIVDGDYTLATELCRFAERFKKSSSLAPPMPDFMTLRAVPKEGENKRNWPFDLSLCILLADDCDEDVIGEVKRHMPTIVSGDNLSVGQGTPVDDAVHIVTGLLGSCGMLDSIIGIDMADVVGQMPESGPVQILISRAGQEESGQGEEEICEYLAKKVVTIDRYHEVVQGAKRGLVIFFLGENDSLRGIENGVNVLTKSLPKSAETIVSAFYTGKGHITKECCLIFLT